MEVSNEIKEDIRKTQSDLKNAIRIHQVFIFLFFVYILNNCLYNIYPFTFRFG